MPVCNPLCKICKCSTIIVVLSRNNGLCNDCKNINNCNIYKVLSKNNIHIKNNNNIEDNGSLINDIKYYNGDKLVYEGQYFNNMPNGYGIQYDNLEKMVYKGMFLNGLRHGHGLGFQHGKYILYEGQWERGIKVGNGIIYNRSYSTPPNPPKIWKYYQGEFINGYRSGKGISYYESGKTYYEGTWKENKPCGYGVEYDEHSNILYEGSLENGLKHGKGKIYNDGRIIYDGYFNKGYNHGSGQLLDIHSDSEDIIDGYWENDILLGENIHICIICCSNRSDIIYIPCKHQTCCKGCHEILENGEGVLKCPLCRTEPIYSLNVDDIILP